MEPSRVVDYNIDARTLLERDWTDQHSQDFLKETAGRMIERLGPQFSHSLGRMGNVVDAAVKLEVKNLFRENGYTEDVISDTEFSELLRIFESKDIERAETWCKKYLFRPIRRQHNPAETAKMLQKTFRGTLVYLCWFCFYLFLIGTGCTYLPQWCCFALRLIMTLHLGYYTLCWLRDLCRILWNQGKECLSLLRLWLRKMPLFILELYLVLFEVFVGWQLLIMVLVMIFFLYGMPFFYPFMSLTSIIYEILETYFYVDIPLLCRGFMLFL